MRTTDLDDLLQTVERIRKEMHPDLDSRLIKAVIYAEKENPEDDAAALAAIERALKLVLGSRGG
jgi:hypothetical protein